MGRPNRRKVRKKVRTRKRRRLKRTKKSMICGGLEYMEEEDKQTIRAIRAVVGRLSLILFIES